MSAAEWAKMPKEWILREELALHKDTANQSEIIQAYKTFICIALHANFHPNKEFERAGSAKISYSQLELMTGASRAVVAKGIARLEKMELVEIDKSLNTSVYTLVDYDTKNVSWAKLPKRYLLRAEGTTILTRFPTRQRMTLHSLKLYLALLSFQDRFRASTLLNYNSIEDYTGINRRFIAATISNLVAHDLIHVRKGDVEPAGRHNPPNEYIIRGFGHWKTRDTVEFAPPKTAYY